MKLNCDLGEGLDDVDAALMPHIHMASIACGGHTGDSTSMARAAELALRHHVSIGAHPSYPDKEHFGRQSISIDEHALFESLCEQISRLLTIVENMSGKVEYIKPHGALYNDAWHLPHIETTLIKIADRFHLPLVLQARPNLNAAKVSHNIIFEAFADRAYTNEGRLVSRKHSHATHQNIHDIIAQARNLAFKRGLHSEDGAWLEIEADTLCVHSDSPNAAEAALAIKNALSSGDDT